jgi:hypothetical protein
MDFLPHNGTKFDDMASRGPTEAEVNSLALRSELRQRTGAVVFVATQEDRREFRKVIKYWMRIKELHHDVDVMLDSSMEPGNVRVGMA